MKKKVIFLVSILALLATIFVGSVAFFSYIKEGSTENTLGAGNIAFIYDELSKKGNGINIEDGMPISDTEGKSLSNENQIFDFEVKSITASKIAIPYEITASLTENSDNIGEIIKVYLTKVDEAGNEEEVILKKYSELKNNSKNDQVIFKTLVPENESDYDQKYRLRMWIDEEANIASGDYDNKSFGITINVNANGKVYTEQELQELADTSLASVTVNDEEAEAINKSGVDYQYVLPMDTLSTTIEAETTVEDAVVTIENSDGIAYSNLDKNNIKRLTSTNKEASLINGNNYFKIKVVAANGKDKKDYVLKVVVGEEIEVPVITGGTEETAFEPVTISLAEAGYATSGIKEYEFYITDVEGNIPTKETVATERNTTGSLTLMRFGKYYVYTRLVSNDGNKSDWSNVQAVEIAKLPTLNTLSVDNCTFNETFDSYKNSYSCDIDLDIFETTIRATADEEFVVTGTGTYTFNKGETAKEITVSNQEGTLHTTYTVIVNRQLKGLAKKIFDDNKVINRIKSDPATLSTTAYDSNESGLYISYDTDSGDNTYYFRGTKETMTNNYLYFADRMWRIVRINEDGSVRIVTEVRAIDPAQAWQTASGENYMYYTYKDSDSAVTFKDKVDEWFEEEIVQKGYLDYISKEDPNGNGYFCEAFKVSYNQTSDYIANFKCENDSKNHGVVKAWAGLLTYDELVHAGGFYDKGNGINNRTFWLNTGGVTMSPAGYNSSGGWYSTYQYSANHPGIFQVGNGKHYAQIVLNLKPDVFSIVGSGSINNYYTPRYATGIKSLTINGGNVVRRLEETYDFQTTIQYSKQVPIVITPTDSTSNVTVYKNNEVVSTSPFTPSEGDNYYVIRITSADGTKYEDYTLKLRVVPEIKGLGKTITDKYSTYNTEPTLTTTASAAEEVGMYVSEDTNSGFPTYYYRGAVTNNYVSFAGYIWRIVRVNEDGTVRLVLSTPITAATYAFQTANNSKNYMYYSYKNSEFVVTAKATLDKWFKANISDKGYLDYVALEDKNGNGYFCEAAKTAYNSTYRSNASTSMTVYDTYVPNFRCTTDTNNHGLVKNYIGLLTYDELVHAGGYYNKANTTFYLKTSYNSQTMSTSGYTGSAAQLWGLGSDGKIGYTYAPASKYYLRPVINLKADVYATNPASSGGSSTYYYTMYNTGIKKVVINNGEIYRSFDSNYDFEITLPHMTSTPIAITPTNDNATIILFKNNVSVSTSNLTLSDGNNTYTIRVTSPDDSNEYEEYTLNIKVNSELTGMAKQVVDKYTGIKTNPTLNTTSAVVEENGFYVSYDTNSGNPTYYYRGTITNNYVQFANMTWRIIRINEDGTVRLILDTDIDNKEYTFQSAYNNKNYMYFTYKADDTVTTAKDRLDDWFRINITEKGYSDYVALEDSNGNGYFCEQAKVAATSSAVNTGMKIYNEYIANYKCSNDLNNHGIVKTRVGLITYDEAIFAGGYYGAGKNYWLQHPTSGDYDYYTMSPGGFDGSTAYVYQLATYNALGIRSLNPSGASGHSSRLRPVINLKTNVSLSNPSSQTGTTSYKFIPTYFTGVNKVQVNGTDVLRKLDKEYDYEVIIPYMTSTSIAITPTNTNSIVTLFKNNESVSTSTLSLETGNNIYTIRVTSEDGNSYEDYTLNVKVNPELQGMAKEIVDKNSKYSTQTTLTTTSNATSENGLYISYDTDSGNPTYYYRGTVTNNYVDFAGFAWRVVRINEDGTIRMVLTSPIDNTTYAYQSARNNKNYTYFTYKADSTVTTAQTTLGDWFIKNIVNKGYFDAIALEDSNGKGYFCESTKVTYSTSGRTNLNPNMKVYNEYIPDYKCPTDYNNHGVVKDYIGLLNYDEIVHAGGYYNTANSTFWLLNSSYATVSMSPSAYINSTANLWGLGKDGKIGWDYESNNKWYLRPVINLKADVINTKSSTTTYYPAYPTGINKIMINDGEAIRQLNGEYDFDVAVPYTNTTSIAITPSHGNSTVKLFKDNVEVSTDTLTLSDGANIYEIKVTSPDGTKSETYSLRILNNSSADNTKHTLASTLLSKEKVIKTNPSFDRTSVEASENGMYVSYDTNSGNPTYYYRGTTTNNTVNFAGFSWKVIRINEDGSVRMQALSQINSNATYKFQTASNNASFQYFTHKAADTSVTAKTTVDDWFKTNIIDKGYIDYVSLEDSNGDGYFCEQAKVTTSNWSTYTPNFRCSKDNNNHGLFKNYVGLITYDELLHAGANFAKANTNFYLYNSGDTKVMHTMSSAGWISSVAYNWSFKNDGTITALNTSTAYALKPVINIRPEVLVTNPNSTTLSLNLPTVINNIKIDDKTVTRVYDNDNYNYYVEIGQATAQDIDINVTLADNTSTVEVTNVNTGATGTTQTVIEGDNYFRVTVTSADETLTASYIVKATIKSYPKVYATVEGDSILEILKNNDLQSGYYKFKVNDKAEEYSVHLYTYNEDLVINENTKFGLESDASVSGTDGRYYANNMVIVKVNGNLTNTAKIEPYYSEVSQLGGPKGFIVYATGTITNTGTIDNSHGAYANGEDVYLYKNSDGTYETIPALGATGGTGISMSDGGAGNNATNRQTAGGGAGGSWGTKANAGGNGGRGSSYSGGAGGGGSYNVSSAGTLYPSAGSSNGGAGGYGAIKSTSGYRCSAIGGAGNGPGNSAWLAENGNASNNAASFGQYGTGGLLVIYGNSVINNGSITAKGTNVVGKKFAAEERQASGGASGGGSINIFYNDTLTTGTLNANGGTSTAISVKNKANGGAGGKGSITVSKIENGTVTNTSY